MEAKQAETILNDKGDTDNGISGDIDELLEIVDIDALDLLDPNNKSRGQSETTADNMEIKYQPDDQTKDEENVVTIDGNSELNIESAPKPLKEDNSIPL